MDGGTGNEFKPSFPEAARNLRRRSPAEAGMRSPLVVVEPPALDGRRASASVSKTSSFRHSSRSRPLKLSTKPFWLRLAGRDVVPGDAGPVGPARIARAGELGAVVADDQLRHAAPGHERVELARHPPPDERGVGHQRQALAGEVVDHGQDAEAPAAGERVGDEVERPALVRPCGTPSAPACRSPACGRRGGAPSAPPRGRAGRASCGSW